MNKNFFLKKKKKENRNSASPWSSAKWHSYLKTKTNKQTESLVSGVSSNEKKQNSDPAL